MLSTERAPSTIYATLTKPYILYTNPNKKHTELPMTPLFSTTKHTTFTAPYPPDSNEYNPTQEETLRKKKAKNPPYCSLFPFLCLFPPLKNKDTRTTNAGREHHKESWRPHTVVKPKPEITPPPPTHFWKAIIYI